MNLGAYRPRAISEGNPRYKMARNISDIVLVWPTHVQVGRKPAVVNRAQIRERSFGVNLSSREQMMILDYYYP